MTNVKFESLNEESQKEDLFCRRGIQSFSQGILRRCGVQVRLEKQVQDSFNLLTITELNQR